MKKINGKVYYTATEIYRFAGLDPDKQYLLVYERDPWSIIKPANRSKGERRLYDEVNLIRFLLIRTFLSTGIKLQDIREILSSKEPKLKEHLMNQLEEIDKRKKELDQQESLIRYILFFGYESIIASARNGITLENILEAGKDNMTQESFAELTEGMLEAIEPFIISDQDYSSEDISERVRTIQTNLEEMLVADFETAIDEGFYQYG